MTVPPARGSKRAPAHLSPEARRIWTRTVQDFELADEPHSLRLLTLAMEASDRAEEARQRLADEGAYVRDRFDQLKAHPAVAVERDSRLQVARLLRELALPLDDADDSRPPSPLGSNH